MDLLKSLLGLVQWLINFRCHKKLSKVHNTFHESNLKEYLFDENLFIPPIEFEINENLNFVKEPVEIVNHKVKKTKLRRFPIIKVRWNAKRGPEYTW